MIRRGYGSGGKKFLAYASGLFRIRRASIAFNATMNDARNKIVCSSNMRHLSRSDIILLLSPWSQFVSPSVKEVIHINRSFLYALCSLSHCQERSFSWLIMIRWAASHRLHANFVIRHMYNQLIINHMYSFMLSGATHREWRSLKNPLFIPALLIKTTSHSWR